MAVVLVRHGENAAAAARSFGDGGLSPRGRDQARALAKRFVSLSFRAALASPLPRARETAELLIENRNVPLSLDPELEEGAIGALDGLSWHEGQQRYPEVLRRGRGVVERLAASGWTAPGGEPRAVFLERAYRVAGRLAGELMQDGHLLVVSHGGLLNAALQRVFAMPPRDEVVFGFEHCGAVVLAQYPHAEPGRVVPHLWFYPPDPTDAGA